MAQQSKKHPIAVAALPLFLENGFKGTSIDMVVKSSGVSKATVYNHFPDKAALMLATLTLWIEANKPAIAPLHGVTEFDEFVRERWLGDESVRIYALVIGEGWRFPEARRLFWEQFDGPWRQAFAYLWKHCAGDEHETNVEQRLDHLLLRRLRDL